MADQHHKPEAQLAQLRAQLTDLQNSLNRLWATQHWHQTNLEAWVLTLEDDPSQPLTFGLSLTHQWMQQQQDEINQQIQRIFELG